MEETLLVYGMDRGVLDFHQTAQTNQLIVMQYVLFSSNIVTVHSK